MSNFLKFDLLNLRTAGIGLCLRCSPYFSNQGVIQAPKEVIPRSIGEIRSTIKCPCCRLFDSLIPHATTRKAIRICSNDSSGITVFDEKVLDPLGDIMPFKGLSTNQDRDLNSTFRLAMVDLSTRTLDFQKLREHLHQCKIEPRCQIRAERNRYRAAIDVTLVDVERMCLVRASTRLPFVALSYVCKLIPIVVYIGPNQRLTPLGGGLSGLMTTSTNREQLEQPGSLKNLNSEISATIRDAITMVGRTGEKWLWCDQLCIEQDNPSQKHSSIQQMDVIYRQSLFTIVALSASQSSDTLPGIRPRSMREEERIEEINGRRFVARAYSPLRNQISHCIYETRGWTFSERMLSPRCLYVTEDFILYHCKNGHCDGAWEQASERERELLKPFNQNFSDAMRSDGQHNIELYESAVGAYTKRKLSYLSDRLYAFHAVLAMLGSEDLGGSICGLPEIHIDRALLWVPVDNENNSQGPFLRNPQFASWSWVGWSGTVDYRFGGLPIDAMSAPIQHSFQTKRRPLVLRQTAALPQPIEPVTTISGIDVLYIKTEFLSADPFTFEQSRRLSPSQMFIMHDNQEVGILYSSHKTLASAQRTLFGRDELSNSKCEFMKLTNWRSIYKVEHVFAMLVGYPAVGLAERLAIVDFKRDFWDSQIKMTKEIALG
jgi:Heterokaryon incompatibility protein (HET)